MPDAKPMAMGPKGLEVLFFDLSEIDAMDNVVRSVGQAKKHPFNPVMRAGDKDAWDSTCACPWPVRGVIYDEEDKLFKCWYHGGDMGVGEGHCGYAVSRDGIVWEKPDLGLVESGGNKHNNILTTAPWGCLIKDLGEPDPARRYKMRGLGGMTFSPDGIHWSKYQDLENNVAEKMADGVALVRDDDDPNPQRRYKFVYQYYDKPSKPGPEEVRFKGMSFSPDALHWTGSADNPILSPNDGFEDELHFLAYVPYKGHYLLLYECAWYNGDGTGRFGRYVGDIRLAHGRDGEHFQRLNPHEIVIPHGAANEWDSQFIVITDKIVVKDDTIYLYYAGMGSEWTSWPKLNQAPGTRLVDPATGNAKTSPLCLRQMGLATLRLDGFTFMRTADSCSRGSFTTKPILPATDTPASLTVNLSDPQPGWSWLQAEVLDAASAEPLPGFSRADCAPAHRDGIRTPVIWRQKSLRDLGRQPIRLRFWLYGAAKLHSFALR